MQTVPNTSATSPFPVADSTLPFWRTQLHGLDGHRSTADLPTQCDVLIVGAGYAGVSTAYHLLDDHPSPPSILMLEARQACSGASARNGGQLRPETYFNIPVLAERYGSEAAQEIAAFERLHVKAIKDLIRKENIDCEFTLTRTMDVLLDEQQAERARVAYEKLIEENQVSLDDVHYAPANHAEAVSGVRGAKGCFSATAAHFWPYKFVMHLLSLVVAKGANLQTATPVERVSSVSDSDGQWLVSTPRGNIRAKKIVYASNGYTAGVLSQYKDKIIPVRGLCSHIVTPEGRPSPHLANTYSIRFGPGTYDYLIPRVDGSIVLGGGTQRYKTERALWYDVADDSRLIEPAKDYFDGYMQKHFSGWEDSGAYTEKVWSGISGYTSDGQPHVGEVPDNPRQYIVAGFCGHGMPVIFLAAKGVAQMLRRGWTYEQTGLPRSYKTSKARLEAQGSDLGPRI